MSRNEIHNFRSSKSSGWQTIKTPIGEHLTATDMRRDHEKSFSSSGSIQ